MVCAVAAPLIYLMGDRGPWYAERPILLAIFLMSLLLVARHRDNISKLMQGTESKLGGSPATGKKAGSAAAKPSSKTASK